MVSLFRARARAWSRVSGILPGILPGVRPVFAAGCLAVFLWFFGWLASPAWGQAQLAKANEAQDKLRTTQQELHLARKERETLASQTQRLKQEESELSKTIWALAQKIRGHETAIAQNDQKIVELTDQAAGARESLQLHYGQIADILAVMTRFRREPGGLAILYPGDSIEAVRSAKLIAYVMPWLQEESNRIATELAQVHDLEQELRHEKLTRNESMVQLQGEEKSLNQALQERRQKRQIYEKKESNLVQKIAELAEQAESLEALLQELEKLQQQAREAREAQKQKQKQKQQQKPPPQQESKTDKPEESREPTGPSSGGSGPQIALIQEQSARSFPSSGKVTSPILGRIVRQWNEKSEIGQKLEAIEVQAPKNGVVLAPFDGQVLYAASFRSYGVLIVLQHKGGAWLSVLSGLDETFVNPGQWVAEGSPIGRIPKNENLRFAIHKNNVPRNPATWLKVSRKRLL